MSLKEQALSIKNETVSKSITPNRLGTFLEESAKVTETVDTIADLRGFDTSQLSNGDIIEVRAHNTNGLNRGLGSGKFVWKATPLFSINNVGGYSAGTTTITVTPTTTGFALPAYRDYESQFPVVVFDNGVIGKIRQTEALGTERDTVIPTGSTTFNIILDGAVPDGANAYHADDDGIRIRPNAIAVNGEAFTGDGYYQRVLHDNFCTPEMYGAIPNHSIFDGAINECSTEIQKAFDSSWNVRMKGGAYYINTPIIAQRGKTIEMSPTYYTESTFEESRRTKLYDESVSAIYITTNIDVIIVRCTDLKWFYGEIDVRNASSTCDKAAFRFDMSANLAFCDLKEPKVTGSKEWTKASENNGITAVLIDIENQIVDSSIPNTFGIGSMYYQYIDIIAEYCHTCYWVNGQPIDQTVNYFTNSVRVNMISQRNKRAVYMESAQSSSYFTGFHQTTDMLVLGIKDWPVSTLRGGGIYFDIFAFDLSSSEYGGFYRNSVATDLSNADVILGPYASKNRHNINYLTPDNPGSSTFGGNKVITSFEGPLLSRFVNDLALAPQRGATYTIGAYNATGVDLETTLGSSSGLPVASNVSISNPDALFSLKGQGGVTVQFNTGADLINDFVEVELTNLNESLWTEEVYVLMGWFGQICKQIQVITGQAGDLGQQTIDITGAFDNLNRGDKLYKFSSDALKTGYAEDTLRIRFIGINELGSYGINELITNAGGNSPYLPYIHTQGGQKILGDLEVDRLIYGDLVRGDKTFKFGKQTYELSKSVSSAELLTGNTSPIELVNEGDMEALLGDFGNPAIIVKSACLRVGGGTIDYPSGTILEIYDKNSGLTHQLDISALQGGFIYKFEEVYNPRARRYNGGANLKIRTADPASGDKDVTVIVTFEIINL